MAIYPPTATFKGEHDGAGNLDKKIIRQSELAETGRYPTTRSYLPLLLAQPEKTPRALDDPNRALHEIYKHIRIYVTDVPNMLEGDNENKNILVTNKEEENYECNVVSGIQSCYNIIAFKKDGENGEINTDQTVYLRDAYCSCDSCRGAITPADFLNCSYLNDMGSLQVRTVRNTGTRKEHHLDSRIAQYKSFLDIGGTIIDSERVIIGIRGGGLALVTTVPEVLEKKCQRMGLKYKRGDVIVLVDMLKKVDISSRNNQAPIGYVDYVRNNSGKMLQRTILLSNIVLPVIRDDDSRSTILHCTVLPSSERIEGLDVHRFKANEIYSLVERENEIFNSLE